MKWIENTGKLGYQKIPKRKPLFSLRHTKTENTYIHLMQRNLEILIIF